MIVRFYIFFDDLMPAMVKDIESKTATRRDMKLANTKDTYGWVSILLHWGVALTVFGMFGLGLYMVELTYYDAWYKGSLDLHKGAGILLAIAVAIRLLWKMLNPTPKALSHNKAEQFAGHAAHMVLYLLLAALFTTGYLISTADGRSIDVFGWFSVPASLTADNQESIAGDIHEWLAWGLIALVALHALAAVKHHVINRDSTLKRMIRPMK
jgi:cytochrome b561|tara:strand:+ start:1411 stop:2043 length:633 start_codon:yes stop_codon:yes gene_type:complete